MNGIAVFAGSFDPFTIGHYDIVCRAAKVFDKVIVGVAEDTGGKGCVLMPEQRAQIARASLLDVKNAEVKTFENFLVDFAKANGAKVIVRGVRTFADFEYEKSLGEVYKSQDSEIELMYLISSAKYSHVSGTVVRELVKLGGNVDGYIQKNAEELVKKFYSKRS